MAKKDKVSVKEVIDAMCFEQLAGECRCCYQHDHCLDLFNRDCGILRSRIRTHMEDMPNIEVVDDNWSEDEDMVPEDDDTAATEEQKDIARSLLQISEYFDGLREEFKTLAHYLYDGVEDE